jgi:YbbR domain-containing protein
MTRALRFLIHNWPLKVAAIALASLLYGGLVLSQTTADFTSPVPIQIENAPADVIVLSNPGAVTEITYVAPPDLGLRIDSATFRASVDLADVDAGTGSASLTVSVEAVDPRVQVLDFEPRVIVLDLDSVATKSVPIRAVLLNTPTGFETGEPIVEGSTATVRGPQSIVTRVIEVQAPVTIDGSGIDVNQLVALVPVDDQGAAISSAVRVDVEPAQVRVRVPIFTDRRSRTLPIRPNVIGTPAAGFEVASVEVDPAVASVEGDANDLAGLDRADTQPIDVAGASSTVTQTVRLALPEGVQPLGSDTVRVTIRLIPVTATRSFQAGVILAGARADRRYDLSTDRVLVTIGGSVADLDRLSGTTLVLSGDVTGLDVGTHSVPLSANLTTGLTLISPSPNTIDVTVSLPTASPQASAGPSATP